MKTLSDKDKLQIMNNVVEPLIKEISPDVIASCTSSMLRTYLNSEDYTNDQPEIQASMIYSAGSVVRLYNLLATWYEG